jgi:hypothetical protein
VDLGDRGTKALVEALLKNTTVASLTFGWDRMGEQSATELGRGLRGNHPRRLALECRNGTLRVRQTQGPTRLR